MSTNRHLRRARAFVFTANNPGPQMDKWLHDMDCKYMCYGAERAETTGTPHYQGFIYFEYQRSLRSVIAHMPGCHVEFCVDIKAAIKYCQKGEQSHDEWDLLKDAGPNYGKNARVIERGAMPGDYAACGEAAKERFRRAWELARDGDLDTLVDELPDIALRYYSTLQRIIQRHQQLPESIADISGCFLWYYGPTGTGKSLTARRENPQHYNKLRNKWWDGYFRQPCVIIEEWSPQDSQYLASHLKQWADHHPFQAEIKGGTICIRPPKIIITSNYSLEECFPNEADLGPLRRRFQVTHFPELRRLVRASPVPLAEYA